jgi:hypothetical protein
MTEDDWTIVLKVFAAAQSRGHGKCAHEELLAGACAPVAAAARELGREHAAQPPAKAGSRVECNHGAGAD